MISRRSLLKALLALPLLRLLPQAKAAREAEMEAWRKFCPDSFIRPRWTSEYEIEHLNAGFVKP